MPSRCNSEDESSRPRAGPPSREHAYRLYFGRFSVVVALVILLGAVLIPADGIGVELCIWKHLTGEACPGCGLTRSVRNLAHGEPRVAFTYHPAGFLVLPYAILAASRPLWPGPLRRGVRAIMARHDQGILRASSVLLVLFLLFGIVRLVLGLFSVWRPF